MNSNEPVVGIDLGTTNSAVAVIEDGTPVIIPVEGQPSMPSCVSVAEDGSLSVGQTALNQLIANPSSTVLSIKRQMGTNTTVLLGGKSYSPEEISALILGKLKQAAEAYLGQPVRGAVITVPAYFDEGQRKATTDAAQLAGLDALRILNEPTAAALAYDAESATNQTLLVYDLGGGTFDVSIVMVEDGVVEVKASHGDTQLGGDDFDAELVKHVCEHFQKEHGINLTDDLKAQRRLKVALERAKRTLTDEPFVTVKEDFLAENQHLTLEIGREDYEKLIGPYLDKTLQCMQRAMKDAGVLPNQLDKILLVGGASRTPAVSVLIEAAVGIEPRFEVDPDLIVALGAAVQAGNLAGVRSKSILVDITPHTFSTSAYTGGHFGEELLCVPLIKRNTPLPCRKADVFFTVVDRQEQVVVDVYQGESTNPHQNTLIGDFVVAGLNPVPSGNPIILEFALDLNGMLKVTATEKSTGLSKEVMMDTSKTQRAFDLDQARQNLASLTGEGEMGDGPIVELGAGDIEGISESAGAGERGGEGLLEESKLLRKRALVLMEGVGEEDSAEIQDLLDQTSSAVTKRDWEKLRELNQVLSDVLFYLED